MKPARVWAMSILATSAAAAVPPTQQQECQKKNGGNTAKAIQLFCAKTNMVIPSDYATEGASYGGGKQQAVVTIDGECGGQWVPQKYCYSQFYDMCATGNSAGQQLSANYGKNNCQIWSIYVPASNIV